MQKLFSKFVISFGICCLIVTGTYLFGFKNNHAVALSLSGLISSNTGSSQGLQNNTVDQNTGSQVVTILRNLSVIKLDDSVFRNPAFGLLTDLSISLPPVTNQGRRNPFAPIGTDTDVSSSTNTNALGGPSF